MSVNPIAASQGTVQSAIALASARTGVDFNYLLGQAQVESGLNATARAATSSAKGLYQFIEQSWLAVVKKHGAEHGLAWAADAIESGAGNRLTVNDPATRQAILDLRNDPQAAALMAAAHAADNKAGIEETLGRTATGTDLYVAHFLGLGGARKFLGALENSPNQIGAALFPAAAHANRGVFYAADGQPRTVADIYARFATKLDSGAGAVGAGPSIAATLKATLGEGLGDDAEVIPGAGESQGGALRWAQATLDQLSGGARGAIQSANLLRPGPDNARLAYLLLASLGGR